MSKVFLISVACLLLAACVVNFTDADRRCDVCIDDATLEKRDLTQNYINKQFSERAAYCNETQDESKKGDCFRVLVEQTEWTQYLLDRTPEEICQRLRRCKNDAERRCDGCIEEATIEKGTLFQNYINKKISEGAALCDKIPDESKKGDCLRVLVKWAEINQYLLDNTPEEFCQRVGRCKNNEMRSIEQASKNFITKPNQLVSKYFKTSLAGSIKQTDCEECLAAASQAKPLLTPEVIYQVVDDALRKCQQIPDPAKKRQCIQEADFEREALEYLMDHTPKEFCIHFGACAGARTLLNAIMMNKPIMSQ